jgi:hypothetical protein
VSIDWIGPVCARRGCQRTLWKAGLCGPCWRLCHMFGKDPLMFAYAPLDGYGDERDAVGLPWECWQQEAGAHGRGLVDYWFADSPHARPPADRTARGGPSRR